MFVKIMLSRIILRRTLSKYLCTQVEKNDFIPVYKFPYIRTIGLINRLKIYQTAVTIAAIPGSIVLCNFSVISADSCITTIVFGLTGTLTMYLFGFIPDKLIGFVYLKNDSQTVRVSYLDFWGRRKNIEIPVKDVVPLTDLPAIPTDPLYLTMRRFSNPNTLKINLKYGVVLDKCRFKTVFLQDV